MRLVSYCPQPTSLPRVGALLPDGKAVLDLAALDSWLAEQHAQWARVFVPGEPAGDLLPLLQRGPAMLTRVAELAARGAELAGSDELAARLTHRLEAVRLRPPIARPPSVRDFYAFEEHVRRARARRGLDMVPEWYELPVFYFSNPAAIYGPEDIIPYPQGTQALDFELEVAGIIGRAGRNIPAAQAEHYIVGYTILNDWSARDIQQREMRVGLGPAKGKDFATSLGPALVTPDELAPWRQGDRYRLEMRARVNGREYGGGNLTSIYWTFAQMIEHAARNVELRPGDVLGSGTVGGGCIAERGPDADQGWLQPGDVVELEVEALGTLRNSVGHDASRPAGGYR